MNDTIFYWNDICLEEKEKNTSTKVYQLRPGDIIYYSIDCFSEKLSLGHIYYDRDFYFKVIKIIKQPNKRKWYQFWIRQKVLGYYLLVVDDYYVEPMHLSVNTSSGICPICKILRTGYWPLGNICPNCKNEVSYYLNDE